MNNNYCIFRRLLLVVFFFQLMACSKTDLKDILHHPERMPSFCNVKKISFLSWLGTLTINFTYDKKGNPIRGLMAQPFTGYPDVLFRYDKYHRLTDYIEAYRNNEIYLSYDYWYHYEYENNRLVRDTVRQYGLMINENPVTEDALLFTTTTYEYDQFSRIIKTATVFLGVEGLPVIGATFIYNGADNLSIYRTSWNDIPTGEITYNNYDDNISITRTNNVWMFLNRNYSINSLIPAVEYNKYRLPVKTRLPLDPESPIYYFLGQVSLNQSDIEYDCK